MCSNCAGDYENPEMTAPPGAEQAPTDEDLAEDAEFYPAPSAGSVWPRVGEAGQVCARDEPGEVRQPLRPVATLAGEVEVAG